MRNWIIIIIIIIIYHDTTSSAYGQRQTTILMTYQPWGKRSQGHPSKDFSIVNVTGTGHEA
jgi:hypothetical protein